MPIGGTRRSVQQSRSFLEELFESVFSIVRDDGSFNASDENFVFSDGGTVVLPASPAQGAVVGIGPLNQSSVAIDGNGNTIEGGNAIYYSGTEPMYVYSDGTNWFVSTDWSVFGIIPDSGVLRYDYEDDADASTALDSWDDNNARNGTISGASYTTTAQIGSLALDFDGTDDYVDTGYNGFQNGESRSYATWIYPRDLSSEQHIMGRWSVQTSDLALYIPSGGSDIVARHYSGTGTTEISLPSALNTWQHIVLTWDSANNSLTGYIDGSAINSKNPADAQSSTDNIFLGQSGTGDDNTLDAILDQTDVYDKELSSSEVSDLYNNGSI